MTDANHSGGGCCGGTRKITPSEPRPPSTGLAGGEGCGCGHPTETAADVSASKPVAAENADGGCCGGNEVRGHSHDGAAQPYRPISDAGAGDPLTDPVCGMRVDPATAKHRADHDGETYFFCSAGCRAKFVSDPVKYIALDQAAPLSHHHHDAAPVSGPGDANAIYTCPMHPEIRQKGPGHCPICGMGLEPLNATAAGGPNPELLDMSRRFWIGLSLALPVFVLEMGGHLFDLHHLVAPQISIWIQFGPGRSHAAEKNPQRKCEGRDLLSKKVRKHDGNLIGRCPVDQGWACQVNNS